MGKSSSSEDDHSSDGLSSDSSSVSSDSECFTGEVFEFSFCRYVKDLCLLKIFASSDDQDVLG